jgi:hypothetical protein
VQESKSRIKLSGATDLDHRLACDVEDDSVEDQHLNSTNGRTNCDDTSTIASYH